MKPRPSINPLWIVAALPLAIGTALSADTLAYWRFEESPGQSASSIPSVTAEAAVIQGEGIYVDEVPGNTIEDPAAGSSEPNTAALALNAAHKQTSDSEELLTGKEAFTVEFFARVPEDLQTANTRTLVRSIAGEGASAVGWSIGITEVGRPYVRMANSADRNQTLFLPGQSGIASILDGQWHHYALTFDSGRFRLYVDGKPSAEKNLSGDASEIIEMRAPVMLGSYFTKRSDGSPTRVLVDEVRISDGALTPGEFLTASDQ